MHSAASRHTLAQRYVSFLCDIISYFEQFSAMYKYLCYEYAIEETTLRVKEAKDELRFRIHDLHDPIQPDTKIPVVALIRPHHRHRHTVRTEWSWCVSHVFPASPNKKSKIKTLTEA